MNAQQSASESSGQGSLEQITAMLLSHRLLVVSLSLFNSWVFAMSWSGAFTVPSDTPLGALTANGFWFVSLGVCTAVLAAFFLIRPLRNWDGGVAVAVAAIAMALSAVLMGLATIAAASSSVLYGAGAVASGLGTGIMTALWGRLIPRYDPSVVLAFITVALLASAVVTLGISVLPAVLGVLIMMIIPLGCWVSFRQALGLSDGVRPSQDAQIQASRPSVPRAGGKDSEKPGGPAKIASMVLVFMGLVVVMGLSAGLLRSLVATDVQSDQSALVFVVATVCAALMLLVSKVPDGGASFSAFYRAIAFIAVAFIVLAFAIPQTPERASFTLAVHTVGFMYFYGLLWVFCAIYTQRNAEEARVFIGGFLANQLGQMGGFFAGGWLQTAFGTQAVLSPVSNAMVYLLLFAVIVLLARLSTEAKVRPTMSSETSMAKACEMATERFGLTPRESEILSYLIKGYDRSYIAQSLMVSPETVKTHTQHIYTKLDAHTRLEVFNAVARCLEE